MQLNIKVPVLRQLYKIEQGNLKLLKAEPDGSMIFSVEELCRAIVYAIFTDTTTFDQSDTILADAIINKCLNLFFAKHMQLNSQGAINIGYNDKLLLLRDYMKSAEIGAISEGLSYLYAQKVLKAISICDFRHFMKKHCNHIVKRSSPDYCILFGDGRVGMLEAKGSATTKRITKAPFQDGINQLKRGQRELEKHRRIKESCVTLLKLTKFGTATEESKLFYLKLLEEKKSDTKNANVAFQNINDDISSVLEQLALDLQSEINADGKTLSANSNKSDEKEHPDDGLWRETDNNEQDFSKIGCYYELAKWFCFAGLFSISKDLLKLTDNKKADFDTKRRIDGQLEELCNCVNAQNMDDNEPSYFKKYLNDERFASIK